MMSLINIFSIAAGISCNYARMKASVNQVTKNTPYLAALFATSALMIPVVLLMRGFHLVQLTPLEIPLYLALMCATLWRYYADVEYRLSLNYKGYFIYYAIISAGYLLGIAAFQLTKLWPLALLPGEMAGLLWVLFHGKVLNVDDAFSWDNAKPVFSMIAVLFGAEFLSTLIFNGDRLLLNWLDSAAVTSYYLASLLGKTVSLVSTPLNSIIIGYLARYKGKMDRRILGIIVAAALGIILVGTLACTVASHILISRLYPDNYQDVKSMFVIANLAQVIYFTANMIVVTLLRFGKPVYNMITNGVYTAAFCTLCIPMTMTGGLNGFCVALLLTNCIRLLTVLSLCVYQTMKEKRLEGSHI